MSDPRANSPPRRSGYSTLWCDTGLLRIGSFRVRPDDPGFAQAGQIDAFEVVFPRTAVTIAPLDEPSFLADPSAVVFYNPGQPFRRRAVDPTGDRCDWFGVHPSLVGELLAEVDPASAERDGLRFPFRLGPSDSWAYRAQRLVLELARQDEGGADSLALEERMIGVLRRVVGLALAERRRTAPAATRSQRELAERARRLLAEGYAQPGGLTVLARAAASSPYALCRAFRAATGRSLHGYRVALRLRASLERVAQADGDLAAIAVDLGFATHSHFTAAFRRAFGQTPSQFRRQASRRTVLAARARI